MLRERIMIDSMKNRKLIVQILLMFVKLIFEDFEHFENRKRVTLTRPVIAGQLKTAIMKADGFTCTTPSHERSRSAETY